MNRSISSFRLDRHFVFALIMLLAVMPLAAIAAQSGVPAVKAALKRMAPGAKIGTISKAPMPGFYQALVGGRMVYISADGTWVMDGHLYNADKQRDLTAQSMRSVRRKALATLPASDFITFAPPHPKYSVTVFTDVDCAYCRVFHKHIKQYNAEGIAVHYLSWPRSGIKAYPSGKPTASYLKSVSVWCATDRHAAFSTAIHGKKVEPAQCTNPVANEFHLGEHIGVNGTPTVIAPDGSVLGGYLTPKQLLLVLKQHKLENAAG